MPTEVVEDILASDFPNLEKLILYVGVEDYGFEGDIEIFRPLFSKERFPKLTYLGLVNSEEQDSIVEMFLESDILPQLETMDISAGTLKDEGAQLLQKGIDEIIRYFGIKLEETMAFGDGGNDITMLRHAAIGVAMGQAKEDVKAAADYVTAPIDEDGISKAMKHFGII